MTYDVACPVCGRINRRLYLEETEGGMECEYWGNSSQDLGFCKNARIPVVRKARKKLIGMSLAAEG